MNMLTYQLIAYIIITILNVILFVGFHFSRKKENSRFLKSHEEICKRHYEKK